MPTQIIHASEAAAFARRLRQALKQATATVRQKGWQINNVDATIVAQAPRLSGHRDAMRASIAVALGISVDAVNVKAKTAERLGPVGQMQAIEARAVVLLTQPKT